MHELNKIQTDITFKINYICHLKQELLTQRIQNRLQDTTTKKLITQIHEDFIKSCSEIPTAFWSRKSHSVSLPYLDDFNETKIPTKARPSQMKPTLINLCEKEIQDLLNKKLISKSSSPWSCTVFYVNNAAEKKCGLPH